MRVPQALDILDIQASFRDIHASLTPLLTQDINLNGRRVINASPALDGRDYLTKRQAEAKYGFDYFYRRLKTRGLDGFPGRLSDPQIGEILSTTSSGSASAPTSELAQTETNRVVFNSSDNTLKLSTGTSVVTISATGASAPEGGSGLLARVDGDDNLTGARTCTAGWTFSSTVAMNSTCVITGSTSADLFNIFDASTEVFTVLDGGNVGINALAPAARLDIVTAHASQPALRVKGTGNADLLNLLDDTTEVFTVLDGGNVGVNVAAPTARLDVVSAHASQPVLRAKGTGNADLFNLMDDSTEVFTVLDGGNIGISQDTPAAKLDIVSAHASQPVLRVKGTGTADLFNVMDNTTEVFTILDGGKVGVNQGTPTGQFTVSVDDGTLPTTSAATAIICNNNSATSDSVNLSLASGTAGLASLQFGNSSDEDRGAIRYNSNADALSFVIATSERARFDSSGNLGLHTTSPSHKLSVRGGAGSYGGPSQIQVSHDDANEGCFITSVDTNQNAYSFNADFTGGSSTDMDNSGVWTARSNEAGIIRDRGGEGIKFFYDTSLTAGSTFTPTARAYIKLGLVLGNPTGGDKGLGAINAVNVYDDNSLLSDWYLQMAQGKEVTCKIPDFIKPQVWRLEEAKEYVNSYSSLPTMPVSHDFDDQRSLGKMVTHLWTTVEMLQMHILELDERLSKKENP